MRKQTRLSRCCGNMPCLSRRRSTQPLRGGLIVLLFAMWCCTMLNNHHDHSTSTVVAATASFSFCGTFQITRLKNNRANNFINKPPLLRMVKVPNRSNAETLPVFGNETDDDKKRSGLLVLLTVPMAWGTFEPAVRYVYSVDVHPKIPAMVFSLSYYLVATIALLLANAAAAAAATMIASSPQTSLEGSRSSNHRSDNEPAVVAQVEDEAEDDEKKLEMATAMFLEQEEQVQNDDDDTKKEAWPIRGGLELGTYLFLGNALQVLGLQTVAADRAAFLLQLTTIFVPLLQAFLEGSFLAINATTWLACLVALTGVAIMGLDDNDNNMDISSSGSSNDAAVAAATTSSQNLLADTSTTTQPSSWLFDFEPLSSMLHNKGFSFSSSSLQEAGNNLLLSLSSGDVLVVAAAVAYSFHCIRLEGFAKQTSAVKLAATKAMTETLLSALVLVGLVLYSSSQQSPIMPATAEVIPSSNGNVFADFCQESGTEIISFFKSLPATLASSSSSSNNNSSLLLVALATIWTGVVTVAYTIYAQSYGQSRVSPVLANLVYTSQPIYTGILAWILLGESLGVAGYLGGALIGSAVLLVVAVPSKQTNNSE